MDKDSALRLALEALVSSTGELHLRLSSPNDAQLVKNHRAITAIKAALEAKDEPHKWKLVPIEPTDEMLKAMDECSIEGYDERLYAGYAASVYMAAVDVAPSPSQQHAEDIAKLGWQYFECPACGSEGARAFPKQEAKDEPVAWMYDWTTSEGEFIQNWTTSEAETLRDTEPTIITNVRPLYTTPPQRKPEQEPVAFSCLRCVTPKKCAIHGCSPNTWPSEDPPHLKPLTDEEIWKFWWNKPEVPEGEDDSMEAQFVAACRRAIEAAHGILGKEQ